MKDIWRKKFKDKAENPGIGGFQVLTGFNANIDRKIDFEELDWNLVRPEELDEVKSIEEVKKVLSYAIQNGKNLEVDASNLDHSFETGETSIGGQAGIMANFLSGLEGSVTFYTPLLSEKLAQNIDEKVLHPYFDGDFTLKNVRDSSNTDRTKENIIIEFKEPKSGRLILSDKLRGFGPYFRSGIADNIKLVDENIQGALLSGFQNIQGNKEAKIEKARQQLQEIDSKIHLEIADTEKEKFKLIGNEILPLVDSIGLDETEALKIAEVSDKDYSEPLKMGEAFDLMKNLMEETALERCHLHTYRYHLLVAEKGYGLDLEVLRDGMIFGELSAIKCAEKGRIPNLEDFKGLDFEDIHVKNLDELEDFADFFNLDEFVETGKALIEDYKVCAIPTLIHEDPKRLVGMGDLISSGAFAYELSKENGQ